MCNMIHHVDPQTIMQKYDQMCAIHYGKRLNLSFEEGSCKSATSCLFCTAHLFAIFLRCTCSIILHVYDVFGILVDAQVRNLKLFAFYHSSEKSAVFAQSFCTTLNAKYRNPRASAASMLLTDLCRSSPIVFLLQHLFLFSSVLWK